MPMPTLVLIYLGRKKRGEKIVKGHKFQFPFCLSPSRLLRWQEPELELKFSIKLAKAKENLFRPERGKSPKGKREGARNSGLIKWVP
jgi:hypothetical protein